MNATTSIRQDLLGIGLIAVIGALIIPFAWVGFIASDDDLYLSYAVRWLTESPVLPTTHWGFRHTVVFPLAASVGLFGQSALSLALPSLIYFLALVALVYYFVRRLFDPTTASVAAILVLSTPLFPVSASIVNADLPETFFSFAALVFLHGAVPSKSYADPDKRWAVFLLLSGISAGFAFMTRETAAGFAIYVAILFLLGAWISRPRYFIVAAGFWIVVGMEWLYYVYLGEGPLYRLYSVVSTHGGVGIRSGNFGAGTGNISDNRLIGPWLAVLVNQEFGLLYYFAAPAAFALWRGRTLTGEQRTFCRLLVGFAAVWFLWISYAGAVRPLPRYFAPVTAAAAILVGIWLRKALKPRAAMVFGSVLLATNFFSLSLENRYPRFGAETYSSLIAGSAEPVYSDPATLGRSWRMLKWKGAKPGLAKEGAPPAGALFFYNPAAFVRWAVVDKDVKAGVALGSDWRVVWRKRPPKRHIGTLLTITGLERFVPESIRYKLIFGNPEVVLFRAAGAPQ